MSSNHIVNFGCRLNAYESEVIKDLAEKAGFENSIFINTCAVTAEAERQARQTIRKIRRENPNAKIIVTGCAAQMNPKKYADIEGVTSVIGNQEKMKLETYQNLLKSDQFSQILVNDIMEVRETASHLVSGFEGKARAFVQIQNGCNHRCTFCTIPYGRGNSRSVPVEEIAAQIRLLIQNGYQEIVLTGVDITAYGEDLPACPTLGQMIRRLLNSVPAIKRLRLSSLDPVEIDSDLWDLIANEPRLMPHLHLSLQAGDDLILKRMKRRHLRQDAINFCLKAKDLRSDVVFGADLIAGFPTETEEMFNNTLRIIDESDLSFLHVFPYSSRPDTPASRMPQVAKNVIRKRAALLREKGEAVKEKLFNHWVGKAVTILVESYDGENKTIKGKTDAFIPVEIKGNSVEEGSLIKAELSAFNSQHMIGHQI